MIMTIMTQNKMKVNYGDDHDSDGDDHDCDDNDR